MTLRPVVLQGAEPSGSAGTLFDSTDFSFDGATGMWRNCTGEALVDCASSLSTTKTATREAIDQTETSAIFGSQLPQTILTKTHEAIDTSDVSTVMSIMTETPEAIDQAERVNS